MKSACARVVLILVSISSPVCALNPVWLDDRAEEVRLGRYLEYLEDEKGSWTIDDVTSGEISRRFTSSSVEILNFGLSASAYWVRFRFQSRSRSSIERFLEVDWAVADSIQLYTPRGSGRFAVRELGDLVPFADREVPYRNVVFRLRLEPGATGPFYMRFQGTDSVLIPLTLWAKEAFLRKQIRENSVFGFFFGTLFVVSFYNLLIFISIRDRTYLYYVGMMAGLLLWQMCLTGLAFEMLWPDHPWWGSRAVHFSGLTALLSFIALTRTYLVTNVHTPKLDVVLRALFGLCVVSALISLFHVSTANYLHFVVGNGIGTVSTIAAIRCWRLGYRPAQEFLLAWTLFVFAFALFGFDLSFGLFDSDAARTYAIPLAFVASAILLSLALGRRINSLKEEQDRAYVLAQGVDRLLLELSQCGEIEELALRSGEELDELLRPEACAVFFRRGATYAPVFVRGRVVPPEIDAEGPMIDALTRVAAPIEAKRWSDRGGQMQFTPAERDMLEGLQASVLLPIHRAGMLSAFICLGAKQSGDPYSGTELALLAAVTNKVASELLRFDEAKLAAIGEQMALMMHDLRNPIAIASGYTDLLFYATEPKEREEFAKKAQAQFHLMRRMAGDVLDYARGESTLLRQEVNLDELLSEVRSELETELSQNRVSLEIDRESGDGAYLDKTRLLRAIHNLARNAVESMPNGGTFRINVRGEKQRLIFKFSDTGNGIPPEIRARLFTPFATAGKESGTGLGLVSIKKVVEEHGGTISVESAPGQGTTFTIDLPHAPPPNEV